MSGDQGDEKESGREVDPGYTAVYSPYLSIPNSAARPMLYVGTEPVSAISVGHVFGGQLMAHHEDAIVIGIIVGDLSLESRVEGEVVIGNIDTEHPECWIRIRPDRTVELGRDFDLARIREALMLGDFSRDKNKETLL